MSPDPYNKNLLDDVDLGIAGKIAKSYIKSPLSLLIYMVLLVLGIAGLFLTPRQEDPQISVPMFDIMIGYPGASSEQVSKLAVEPLEKILFGIKGVEHIYSATERGQAVVTVQFTVGEDMEISKTKIRDKISSHMDKMPNGVMPPLIRSIGIDDVPLMTVTFWSKDKDGDGIPDVDDAQLRVLATDVLQRLKEIPETGETYIVGGRKEIVKVEVMPEKLSSFGVSLRQIAGAITTANHQSNVGSVETSGSTFKVETGGFLRSAQDIETLVIGNFAGSPVHIYDVAHVTQEPEDSNKLVSYYTGSASTLDITADGLPAVTIGIAKKQKTNGVSVAEDIKERLEELKGKIIPDNVVASITRDYGETAKQKVNELIFKLFKATAIVFFLVLFAFRALKPAIVVLAVIPVVLLFTIFAAYILGFTIDRVSLFALIFSIGILVDDAIVVVENIYRRWLEAKSTDDDIAIDAVREVGNPTILATGTVIAALMPMAAVSGMMGPYMLPIPALGSVAMIISLLAAFMFTPWLAASERLRPSFEYLEKAEAREHKEAEMLGRFYIWILVPLNENGFIRFLFKLCLWGGLIAACSMFYFKAVKVKMLPLDNKPEFSVMIDMPAGTALADTANIAQSLANLIKKDPEVTAIQVYAGTSRPFDFNGMVRHYYLRSSSWLGELQVQLTDKHARDRTSHIIADDARKSIQALLVSMGRTDVKISVVEMPPGPPVLQSVVADIHGPDAETRRQFAKDMTEMFKKADSLVDVDNYMRGEYEYWRFIVDVDKANRRGVSVATINENLAMALGGQSIGDIKPTKSIREPVNIFIQVPLAKRSQITNLSDLPIMDQQMRNSISLGELGRFVKEKEEPVIYHKDLRGVEYVVADVGGELAAPVYGMLQVQDIIRETGYKAPDGVVPNDTSMIAGWFWPPKNDDLSAYEWTGEWTVTYETFRDMGGAFMVALLVIYMLVVWEFGNFRVPGLIMAPIPLTLLGIIPAHYFMDAEFTATSMIGWIALAGIIVRNSILLVDFTAHEVGSGSTVCDAVIRSCKTRTRPIVITALALVGGSLFILNDPIFQGMAISLISGVLVSTILTLVVIPLGCMQSAHSICEVAQGHCPLGMIATPDGHVHIDDHEAVKKGTSKVKSSSVLGAILLLPFTLVFGILKIILSPFIPKPVAPVRPPRPSRPPRPAPKAAPVVEEKEAIVETVDEPAVEDEKPAEDDVDVVKTVEVIKKVTKKKVAKKKVAKKKRGIQLKDDDDNDNGLN